MPNDKIRGAHMVRIAHFLGKKGLFVAGHTSQDFREFTDAEFFKRFGLDFLSAIKRADIARFNALVSRCPALISYQFKPEENPTVHLSWAIATFKNMTAFDLALGQVVPEEIKDEERESYFGQQLLHHVIRGNQMGVTVLLTRYPHLLSYRGNIADYPGRMFKNVTGFELALWALDVRHMAPAMLKCLTNNEERKDCIEELLPELQRQFDNVVKEGGGVNYTIGCGLLKMSRDPSQLLPGEMREQRDALLNGLLDRHNGCIQYNDRIFYFHNHRFPKELVEITDSNAINALKGMMNKEERKLEVDTLQLINNDDELKIIQNNVTGSQHIFKEKHYDFTQLTEALRLVVRKFDEDNVDGSFSTWTGGMDGPYFGAVVGLAQHYAPAHVAQHYCNPDESFDPSNNYTPPAFDEKVLRRVLSYFSSGRCQMVPWWPASSGVSGSIALGFYMGVVRGGEAGCSNISRGDGDYWVSRMDADSAALMALYEVRKSDVLELKQLLDSLQKPDADPEPARCVAP